MAGLEPEADNPQENRHHRGAVDGDAIFDLALSGQGPAAFAFDTYHDSFSARFEPRPAQLPERLKSCAAQFEAEFADFLRARQQQPNGQNLIVTKTPWLELNDGSIVCVAELREVDTGRYLVPDTGDLFGPGDAPELHVEGEVRLLQRLIPGDAAQAARYTVEVLYDLDSALEALDNLENLVAQQFALSRNESAAAPYSHAGALVEQKLLERLDELYDEERHILPLLLAQGCLELYDATPDIDEDVELSVLVAMPREDLDLSAEPVLMRIVFHITQDALGRLYLAERSAETLGPVSAFFPDQ